MNTESVIAGGTKFLASQAELDAISYNDVGLVPAIVQDHKTGKVLMMAWMNADTLHRTLSEGRTVFWSRSRSEVWAKGETSGNVQLVKSASYDCDADTLLFQVDQVGGSACHTGETSCFFNSFSEEK